MLKTIDYDTDQRWCAGCGKDLLHVQGFKWVTSDGLTYCSQCAADIERARD